MTDIDDAIERAKDETGEFENKVVERLWQVLTLEAGDTFPWCESAAARLYDEVVAPLLAVEVVKRLRRFIPPDGWVQFGTHANCRDAWLEFSEEVGEDGLPLWERVVVRQDLDPDEMVSDPRWTQ